MMSLDPDGSTTTVEPFPRCEATSAWMAPSITLTRIAAPNRSMKCRSTWPGSPARPSSSVPGEASGTTTPLEVRASVHRT